MFFDYNATPDNATQTATPGNAPESPTTPVADSATARPDSPDVGDSAASPQPETPDNGNAPRGWQTVGTDSPETQPASPAPSVDAETAERKARIAAELRESVIAIELRKTHVGRVRQLSRKQRDEITDRYGANRDAVSSSKKLFRPGNAHIKAITEILNSAYRRWCELTIKFRHGVRLLRRDALPTFIREMESLQPALNAALAAADENYDSIMADCREYLGAELFDARDYPATFAGSVSIRWHVHNFEPSEDLAKLSPATYRREQERVRRQFEETLRAFEDETREQLAGLCDALLAKLNPASGAKVKYTESAIVNFREFFERFKSLGIVSDDAMADLIAQSEQALSGVPSMQALKKSPAKRADVAQTISAIRAQVGTLIETAPERSIDIDDLD